jgi:hypothetical protein
MLRHALGQGDEHDAVSVNEGCVHLAPLFGPGRVRGDVVEEEVRVMPPHGLERASVDASVHRLYRDLLSNGAVLDEAIGAAGPLDLAGDGDALDGRGVFLASCRRERRHSSCSRGKHDR